MNTPEPQDKPSDTTDSSSDNKKELNVAGREEVASSTTTLQEPELDSVAGAGISQHRSHIFD